MSIKNDLAKIVLTKKEINEQCVIVGKKITEENEGKDLICVGVLKGCNPFMSDLIKQIDLPIRLDYMAISSYNGGTTADNGLTIDKDLKISVKDENVLIIEDIIDRGETLKYLKKYILELGAKSVKIVTLLNKNTGSEKPVAIDYCCFEIENEFIVGYGMDYDEKYRNLEDIGILKETIMEVNNEKR